MKTSHMTFSAPFMHLKTNALLPCFDMVFIEYVIIFICYAKLEQINKKQTTFDFGCDKVWRNSFKKLIITWQLL